MHDGVGLVRVSNADVQTGADLLARAFHDEPLMCYFLPDDDDRARLSPFHFERTLRLALMTGEVWRTEAFDGVACWMAPGRWPATAHEAEQAGLHEVERLVGRAAWQRFETLYGAMDRTHEQVVSGPHWDLWLIGVEPTRHGRGIGSRLMRPMWDRFDSADEACYLETLDPRALSLYRRHGFAVAAEDVEPTSGLRYWCCVREPVRVA